ncbi:MAG: HlyD family secretion protein [Phenylobacterium sp.]|nr:HlyD family secretion protein [Phenylobacterium sp.]
MRRFPILTLLGAAALLLGACHKPAPGPGLAQQARAVSVVTVEPHAIVGALAASGDLVPRQEAAVAPEVTGYRVAAVLADVGQFVKAGETLVRLDPALIESQLAQQQALAAQAEAQAAQAEDQAARVKGLEGQGVLSEEQIDQRRFQARAARATANAQAAALRDVRTRAGKLAVTAPVGGLILEKTVRPGDLSAVGATPWFRIAADGQIELQAQLSEDDLARIRPGQHAEVTLPSGQTTTGVVRLISPQIDPQSKLGFVRITLPVRGDIRAGGFGRAVFTDAAGVALAIPETAVRYDADGASVMVVQADNRVKRVPIRTGMRGGGLVQIVEGPPVGARIVQNAASFLLDGDRVAPANAAAPAAASRR